MSRKSLVMRQSRAERAMRLVCIIEPGVIALRMRRERIALGKEIDKLWGVVGSEQVLHQFLGDELRVVDVLLRLARIPQAPAGARAGGKERPQLDVSPSVDAQDLTPPAPEGESK